MYQGSTETTPTSLIHKNCKFSQFRVNYNSELCRFLNKLFHTTRQYFIIVSLQAKRTYKIVFYLLFCAGRLLLLKLLLEFKFQGLLLFPVCFAFSRFMQHVAR